MIFQSNGNSKVDKHLYFQIIYITKLKVFDWLHSHTYILSKFKSIWALLDWPCRDTPHPRTKEKPQQDGRRGKFMFRIKPHSRQRRSEGSNKPCVHHDPGTPQRLIQNCVWASSVEVWVGGGLPQKQGIWVQQTWVCHKPSWRRSPLTPLQKLPELTPDWEIDS